VRTIRNLVTWKHGDHETGSSYYHTSERDRDAISGSKNRFSKLMERRPTLKFCIVLHEFILSGSMAITKPEVVITIRQYEIEIQILHLNIGFWRQESQSNIERHEVMKGSWTMPTWKQEEQETGSSYYYASERDRNAISVSWNRCSSTQKPMDHRPTWSSARVIRSDYDVEISQITHCSWITQ